MDVHEAAKVLSEAARVLRQHRRRTLMECPVCHKVFLGEAGQVYCCSYHAVLGWKRAKRGYPLDVYQRRKRRVD